ncbi:hypothetical protein VNI00_003666 [Paramarasmius palmivorus]|uniref:JmjC domain-containing protein n=1 Tax=Paramarasmius palmivorus TaxID=297713 RepID=A0AAW0DS81_9AGAR
MSVPSVPSSDTLNPLEGSGARSPLFGESPAVSGRSTPIFTDDDGDDSSSTRPDNTILVADACPGRPANEASSSPPLPARDFSSGNDDPSSSPLFKSMPWYTSLLVNEKDRMSMIPEELKTTAKLLLEWYRGARDRSLFVDVVENRSSMKPNQKSAGPVAALMFGFRFLDVAALVASPDPVGSFTDSTDVSVLLDATPPVAKSPFDSETLTLRGMSLLYANGGWPALISSVKTSLDSSQSVADPVLPSASLSESPKYQLVHAAYRQLACISDRHRTVTLSKQLLNMEMAAFFINWLLLGNKDFPEKTKELYEFLAEKAKQEALSADLVQELSLPDVANFKPDVTKLRQPLFFALAISPLMLLCNFSPISTNISRLSLMRAWFYYGNARPPVLSKVEVSLWTQLFAMAKGLKSSRSALSSFVSEVSPLLEGAEEEKLFFSPHDGLLRLLPRGLAHGRSTTPDYHTPLHGSESGIEKASPASASRGASPVSTTDIDVSLLAEAIAAQFLKSRPSELPPVTPSVIPPLEESQSANAGGSELSSSSESTLPLGEPQSAGAGESESTSSAAGLPDLSETGELLASTPEVLDDSKGSKSNSSDQGTSGKRKTQDKNGVSGKKPKPKAKAGSSKDTVEESNRRKLRDRSTGSYQVSFGKDADDDLENDMAVDAQGDDSPLFEPVCDKERVGTDLYLLRSPFGMSYAYRGAFYSRDIIVDFVSLVDRANRCQTAKGLFPLFSVLSGRARDNSDHDAFVNSMFGSRISGVPRKTLLQFEQVEEQHCLQNAIACSNILVCGGGAGEGSIDRELLSSVGACSALRQAHDLSKRGESSDADDQIVRASFDDFLKAVGLGGKGKIVNFLDIPGADSSHSTLGLSSNMASHRYSMSLPRYSRARNLVPMRDLFWHLLAAAHASHPGHVDANGFGTELIVHRGLKLVFLGLPSDKDPHVMAKVDAFKRFKFDLSGPESANIAGILMFPGDRLVMQPCTPHYVFTLCPSLCHGAHFFAASTMERSYWGIVHTFFRDHEITNQDHPVYHDLLFRMTVHWHDVIVNDTASYLNRCRSVDAVVVDHVPNVRYSHGWLQLFALFGLMELGTILLGDRHEGTNHTEIDSEYKHMRRLCGEAIRVLDSNASIGIKGGTVISVTALARSYFVQQFIAVIRIAGMSGHVKRTAARVELFVDQDTKRDNPLRDDIQEVLAGRCVEYGPSFLLDSSKCSTLRWAFADAIDDGFPLPSKDLSVAVDRSVDRPRKRRRLA